MSWIRRLVVVLGCAATASWVFLGIPAPAHAERVAIGDEVGDTTGTGLDFTGVVLRNRDHAVVARMTFERDRRGEVIVAIRVRGHGLVARVVSAHRRRGNDRVRLLTADSDNAPCEGLRSTWNREAAKMRLRLPSKCLLDGDYGAVRSWFLIEELGGGGDVDYAPEQSDGDLRWTNWISRG